MNDLNVVGDRRAKAHPTKAFFVRMLTRDISLEDCILDLIDNSIDAAWRKAGEAPTELGKGTKLGDFEINLTIVPNEFRLSDNCGGISLDQAADYAFTFGRDELGSPGDEFSVGVYGIGMKRAVFKMGNQITITSDHEADEPFVVPINVPSWLTSDSETWDFDIDPTDSLEQYGVDIHVTELSEETVAIFDDPAFVNGLRTTIARDYMLPLMQGLKIRVNGTQVPGWEVSFRSSREFRPLRVRYEEDEVSVQVIAGMIAPPTSGEFSERDRDAQSGWYVLCNGRVVVAADRTSLTVWGKGKIPSWHPQFKGFVGVVLFSSTRPELLPMTTTKNSIDAGSAIYRRAQAKMAPPTRAWVDYTNARKANKEEAKAKESQTKPTPIDAIEESSKVQLPKDLEGVREANVLYTVPKERMTTLARAFGKSTMSYKQVGLRSFDYAYDQLVDE